MPSSYTTRNRLEKQAAGENNNTWGTRLNDNVIEMMDESSDGVTAFSLSGSRTLTTNNAATDESRKRVLNITGGTGGTVGIPNVEKLYLVRNNSSGSVVFTTGSGTTATVIAGVTKWIFCEGSNVVRQASGPDFGNMTVSTSGLGSFGTLTTSGAADFAGIATGALGFRATGSSIPGSGTGLELRHDVTGGGYVLSYNRSGSVALPLSLQGSSLLVAIDGSGVGFNISGTNITATTSTFKFFGITTTASAANAFLDPVDANSLKRSTSSLRYKRDIEDIDRAYSDAVLKLRPVWYRSKAEGDNQDWGFWGIIAEEAAEVDPRLVHWGHTEDDYETVVRDKDGNSEELQASYERRLKDGAVLVPDGFQYERLSVLLLDIIKRQESRIADLEAICFATGK